MLKKNNKAYVKQISCTTAGVTVEKNFQHDRSAVSKGVHIVVGPRIFTGINPYTQQLH